MLLTGIAVTGQLVAAPSAKDAAQKFYAAYLPVFGAPFGTGIKPLQPYLSPRLVSLLMLELRRQKAWSAKHPDEKPPLTEDLFSCNHEEPPQKFQLGAEEVKNGKSLITVHFEYHEGEKVIARCQARAVFVFQRGKWLLDNVLFEQGADLQTLLSRKNYSALPQ